MAEENYTMEQYHQDLRRQREEDVNWLNQLLELKRKADSDDSDENGEFHDASITITIDDLVVQTTTSFMLIEAIIKNVQRDIYHVDHLLVSDEYAKEQQPGFEYFY